MSLVATAAVTAMGAACAAGTIWLARRAEQAEAPPVVEEPAPEPPWWEAEPWWPALSDDERQWVVRNLVEADTD